ncbi:MAG TPA: excinuclease ABC subunit UvrA [Polyangiaceae bacterium]|nr:excinuclease ABC subunit UvrA [Polyangiaceae bacterium]
MLSTRLRGARTHNLQGLDLDLEPGQVLALTGVSGAGKSSLALDTLYAEGQRRFVESFSPYARQFLERLERPPMTGLEPVPAAIAVDRRAPVKSSRSTLATMADIEPFLAALFVREAQPLCPEHRKPAIDLDTTRAAQRVQERFAAGRVIVCWSAWSESTEHYLTLRDQLARDGYRRIWLDGQARDIDTVAPSALGPERRAKVIVDRCNCADPARVASAIEAAWQRSGGLAEIFPESNGASSADPLTLRRGRSCPDCARPLGKASMGLFSYESPLGACAECRGFGRVLGIDWNKVIPDHRRSLSEGAVRPWSGKSTTWERGQLRALCRRQSIPMDVPFANLSPTQQALIVNGDSQFEGLQGWFEWLNTRTYKMHVRVLLSRYRSYDECPGCKGQRLGKASLDFVVAGLNIAEWHGLEVSAARAALSGLVCESDQGRLARSELLARLTYLERVGLGYLTLDRQARTLSGGEAQRVTLTAALGTSLHNALFVLDEPSVGLHAADVGALADLIGELATRNNSVLVLEHDEALIRTADRVVELGPKAGSGGGRITFDGTPAQAGRRAGPTQRALAPLDPPTRQPRKPTAQLSLRGARENNLQQIDVDIPLGVLCAISGPSGSGKSTLIVDIVYRALARRLGVLDVEPPGAHRELLGAEAVRKVVLVDQAPLGRTSRGNAATYTKAWDYVRKLFAEEPSAKSQGLTASHFSFNVALGRCDSCAGEGFETVEMQFLADVRLSCPACRGRRFKPEVLRIQRQGVQIADVLEMTIDEAIAHFVECAPIRRNLSPLSELGLGYVRLGQPLSTLSGGEAQRLKLARSLSERRKGSLWILDEPSAGLHPSEIDLLWSACEQLVDGGGSVLMVEHDLELIARADWVIDMGPQAGRGGGRVVAAGPPSAILEAASATGQALRERTGRAERPTAPPRSAPQQPELVVRGAREHNLKDLDVALPHQALTVVTGPSGSGKSSLAFDVIFAEGQRRFLETLTPYARQFLPSMPRPDVDRVSGIPPSVSLEQRTARSGAKSTVATVTEISHYLRLIVAKLGTLHCPDHDLPVATQSPEALLERLQALRGAQELCAPLVRARKGTYLELFNAAAKAGFERAIVDGEPVRTDPPPKLVRTKPHTIRLSIAPSGSLAKLSGETLGRALSWGKGEVVLRAADGSEQIFSTRGSCPECGFSESELDPRIFSFNTEQGRCPRCEGNGVVAVEAPKKKRARKWKTGRERADDEKPLDTSVPLMTCPSCSGSRLAPVPRAVRLYGERYADLCLWSIERATQYFQKLQLSGRALAIGADIQKELARRLEFLCDVGLGYLSLSRAASTLSGGEMQRLRLAAQLGAGLTGALYVLDEPTIGLHPKDTERLLGNLRRLVDLGSTVLVVEHDADTVRAADHLIDMGPSGGSEGGRILCAGSAQQVLANPVSPTGQVLSRPPVLRKPTPGQADHFLTLEGAREHNLKNVDLRLPLGRMSVIAGVSGSGKSTLVRKVLLPAVREALGLVSEPAGKHRTLSGHEQLMRAVSVDQSPIGRTPRSVPATFLGIWDPIRKLFAASSDAMVAGFDATRFSFNSASGGGRCEQCNGMGAITHEMSFLPDVVQACPSCGGQRFEPRTLGVRYRGHSIADVLALPAARAAELFANHPKIAQPLQTLCDLGTGYITLGQGSHTLSGGEAQRLKLADELTAGARHEPTLYVLDEPTTGLHLSDVARLMNVLDRLVARGDTLVIIEHHPWVIAGADYVVELGPTGGEGGGHKVAEGTPAELARGRTPTGRVIAELTRKPTRKGKDTSQQLPVQ